MTTTTTPVTREAAATIAAEVEAYAKAYEVRFGGALSRYERSTIASYVAWKTVGSGAAPPPPPPATGG